MSAVAEHAPGPLPSRGQPLSPTRAQALRNVAWFQEHPLSLFAAVLEQGGRAPLVLFNLGIRPAAVVGQPSGATAVLTHPAMEKDGRPYGFAGSFRGFSVLKDLVGASLPVLEADDARQRRRLLMPAFGHAQRCFVDLDPPDADARFEALLSEHTHHGAFDIYRTLSRTIFERLCWVLFGDPYRELSAEVAEAVDTANLSLHHLCSRWIPGPMLSLGPTARALRGARQLLLRFADRILADLADRSPDDGRPAAAFALWDTEALSREALVDEIATQLVAGTESTSLAASWICLMLARHPTWWRRASADVRTTPRPVLRRGGLTRPAPLSLAIREGLRLFPSFWQYLRVAQEEVTLCGTSLAPGTIAFVSPYLLQRDPARFTAPNTFRPDREQEGAGGPSLTFGTGPRACIGGRLAHGLITDALADLLSRFETPLVDLGAPAHGADGADTVPLIFGLKRRGGFVMGEAS